MRAAWPRRSCSGSPRPRTATPARVDAAAAVARQRRRADLADEPRAVLLDRLADGRRSPSRSRAPSPVASRRRGGSRARCRLHRRCILLAARCTPAARRGSPCRRRRPARPRAPVQRARALLDRLERRAVRRSPGRRRRSSVSIAPVVALRDRDRDRRRRPAPDRLVERLADDRVERDLRLLAERSAASTSSSICDPVRDAELLGERLRPPARSPGRAARPARGRTRGRAARGSSRAAASSARSRISRASSGRPSSIACSAASSISAIPASVCTGPSWRKSASRRRSSCSAVISRSASRALVVGLVGHAR